MFSLALDWNVLLLGIFSYENYKMEQRLEWNYHGLKAFTQYYSGSNINLGPENDDNTLGSACPDIIAVHYVCFIYTISHTPAMLTDR